MLSVYFAVSLDILADELINDLKKNWKSPLDAPVVIFADNKIEQWFKLKWLEKQSVLANLNTKRLDSFLLEILTDNNKKIRILDAEILRNVILSYLTQKNTDNKYNYEILDSGVKRYLEDNGILNELRLFDFATEMANLFKEYEITRPSGFSQSDNCNTDLKGFIETWSKERDNSFFRNLNKSVENEDWQQHLYYEIFFKNNSGMQLANSRIFSYQRENVKYYTLPQIYENKINFLDDNNQLKKLKNPIYVLGLSGIGQFYRVALQKIAENNEIKLFIQSPAIDSVIEEQKLSNNLLKIWGKPGFENISLWLNKNKDNIYIINKTNENNKNTLLDNLKETIINNTEHIDSNINENNASIRITAAPSKIREIENLHSHICRLLNGSLNNDEKAKFSDILVVSPRLDDYKTAILEVFAQSQTKSEEERDSKDKSVISLPFCFVDSSATESLSAQALHILFLIREKGVLSRPEFFSLVRNPVVQYVRNIKNEEIADWERWITDMNIYRDKKDPQGDISGWLDAVKRLLLARLSSEAVFDGEKEYQPYSNIASGDNDSLCRFIDCVESLENWISKEKWIKEWNNQDISSESLDSIMEFIGSWIYMKEPPKEFINEAIIYKNIKSARESLKFYYATGSNFISWKLAHLAFLGAAKNADYNSGSVFINGITFMKFAPNRSIPTKYLFLIGADSESLPGRNSDDSLDLRNKCGAWNGDVSITDKNRFAFLSQLLNTSNGFFISYVNKDLQKDEDFYPSSLITDLKNFLKKSNCIGHLLENEITLDETRDWKDLFTKREIRNKITQQSFDGSAKNFNADLEHKEPIKIPSMVKFFSFKQFLQDPFEFQANRILGIEDIEEDPEKTEFEPVEPDFFYEIKLERMMVALGLGIQPENSIKNLEELSKKAIERGWIPEGIFGGKSLMELIISSKIYTDVIENFYPKEKYSYSRRKITVDIENDSIRVSWKLTGEFLIVAENLSEIHFINIFKSRKNKVKNYLGGYIAALALLCSDENIKQDIYIDSFWIDDKDKPAHDSMLIKSSAVDAEYILNGLYEKAYCQQFSKVIPIELFDSKELTYNKYINSFKDNNTSPWYYFPAAKIFDIRKVCGFEESDFEAIWTDEVNKQKELMPDLWLETNTKSEAENGK